MRRPRAPETIRTRLLLSTIGSVGVALVCLLIILNLAFARRLDANATDQAHVRARAELAVLDVTGGKVRLEEAADAGLADSLVWVVADHHLLEAPNDPSLTPAATALANGQQSTVDAGDMRLASVPILDHGRKLGAVVAGVSLEPYEEAQRTVLLASIVVSVALLIVVALVTRWILARAFAPVSTMTTLAQTWSEHDIDRRFDLGPRRDELTALAATLDDLLDRNASALHREQRLTAEISHELRTPLARIATDTELALRRPRTHEEYRAALEAIDRNVEAMRRIIDTLLASARAPAEVGSRRASAALDVAERAAEAAAELAADHGVSVRVHSASPDVLLAVDRTLATQILQPVVDNACRYAATSATIEISRDPHTVVFSIKDDGDGLAADDLQRVFQPGVRGSLDGNRSGAGLGLALARRLATTAGGTIDAAPGPGGKFVIKLPADGVGESDNEPTPLA
jgi:two-component system, OmpR family, sensor kinase